MFPLFHTRFISISDDFDSSKFKGDTGGMDVAFKYLISEYYSRDMSIKTKSAKYAKMQRGEYQSKICPYGYRKSADGRMEPDPEAAAVVQLIFQLAAEGINATAITRELFRRNIPTPGQYKAARGNHTHDISRCHGIWSTSTILRILEDERYTGVYVIGKRAVLEVGGNRSRLKDRESFGNTKYVYAWRLTPTDPTPKGKREKPSLRELEQQIRRDIEDGIDSTGKKMTLCQLYAKQNAQRANVKKSTIKQREQLMRLLKEDKLGARSIDTIKPSDAKEWALRMKDKGFSYNTINNHKRSLKASFYIAIQDDCVRKNPFDFKLSEVLENDTKEKVALTEEQEQALLSFIKTDNVYHKYYDDVLILLKTGLRISELCGLTVADIDFKNEVVIIDHQLLKSKEQGYYIETPKTKSGIRQVPLSRETIQAFQRVIRKRTKGKLIEIDGYKDFLFVNPKGNPKVAIDYNALFVRMVKKCNKHHKDNPLPHITPHTLRHTFCTRLASKNMNPKDLQYIMGHSNISITMNWYAHASIDTAKSEVQRLIA